MRGEALQHRGGAVLEGQLGGQRDQAVGRDHHALGVGSDDAGPRHPIAHLHVGHARAHRGDGAGAFHARRERQGRLVGAGAEVDVDVVHAAGLELHLGLTGCGRGRRDLLQLHGLGAARCVDANRLHGRSSFRPRAGCEADRSRSSSPRSGDRSRASPRRTPRRPGWRGTARA